MRQERRQAERQPHTFVLDQDLVERARREVGEQDMVRSIEAALAAAIDYNSWVREVRAGRRDVIS
jgi:post-segregation antitoxin (ccd killing protein)